MSHSTFQREQGEEGGLPRKEGGGEIKRSSIEKLTIIYICCTNYMYFTIIHVHVLVDMATPSHVH